MTQPDNKTLNDLHYNYHKGFSAWYQNCLNHFEPPQDGAVEQDGSALLFHQKGYAQFPLFGEPLLSELHATLSEINVSTPPIPVTEQQQGAQRRIVLRPTKDRRLAHQLIEAALTPLHSTLTHHFKCHYMVFGFGIVETPLDVPERNISYQWHRDAGPTPFLKLMIYLTDCTETGAGTEVIDKKSTELISQAGYDFPDTDQRVSCLKTYYQRAQLHPNTELISPQAGVGLLFQPVDVLY